jgi:pimeloyl-ACP methyl ester carboxylesterase
MHLLFLSLLLVQDAGSVLRSFVSYNAQKASLPLSEDQRKEADRLGAEAQKAGAGGNYAEATRLLHRGLAVMQGAAWTSTLEFAASLEARADHAIARPGQALAMTLRPVYAPEATAKLKAAVYLTAGPTALEEAAAIPLVTSLTLDAARLRALPVTVPTGTAPGNYYLETRLAPVEGEAGHPAAFTKRWAIRVGRDFGAEVARLEKRLAAEKHPLAEYVVELYARADRGEANPHRYDFAREFAEAHRVLDAAAKKENPFAGRRGDLRMAYRSAVDQTLQPYRLYVPTAWDGKRALPLVVALHGMGGDENSIFDAYRNGAFKEEAERRGWMMVCPKGRDSASMYRGTAETDVLDVLADVRRQFAVDGQRIYLMGHSMGGYGTWSIAMNHPEIFAALGPVAGGGNAAGMAKIAHIPQFVVHGDNDKTVPVGQSRNMVAAARKAQVDVEYVEVAGGSHSDIVVPNITPMFEFFAKKARRQ